MSPVELLPPHRAVHGDPEWLEIRRQGVTASEIAVILGLSRWDSPWSLWHRKRGLIGESGDSEDASWGRRLEGAIADAAAERLDPHENLVFRPAGLYRHGVREWQMATPDRLVHEICSGCLDGRKSPPEWYGCSDCMNTGDGSPPLALLEVKHPYSWDGWGDDGSDDIPADYAAQALWQADVMGVDEVWLAAYTRHQMRCYTIHVDDEAQADLDMMRTIGLEFLRSDEPPPLDSHPATLRAAKALHPDLEDREQQLPEDVAREYRAAVWELDHAKDRKRAAEIAVRDVLGSARYGLDHIGARLLTRSIFERRSVDGGRLRVDHPDIAAAYTTTSTVDKLTPSRKGPDHEQD